MKKNFLPAARNENLALSILADETLVYDFITDKAFCLNETCGLVWSECDGKKTVADITRAINAKLKSPANEDVVYLALNLLNSENLLVADKNFTGELPGISRRKLIKKVGMATAVAIPLISALTAPQSADAASTVVCEVSFNQMCVAGSNNPTQCCRSAYMCLALSGNVGRCLTQFNISL